MGYYSDVRFVTDEQGFKKINDYIENVLNYPTDYNILNHATFIWKLGVDENVNEYYIGFDNFKWYDVISNHQYEPILAFENTLSFLKKENIPFYFCRIGEEYNDIEINCCHPIELDNIPSVITEFEESILEHEVLTRESNYVLR